MKFIKYIVLIPIVIVGYFLGASLLLCLGLIEVDTFSIPIVVYDTFEYTEGVVNLFVNDFGGLLFFIISLTLFSILLVLYRRLARKDKTKSIAWENVKRPFILYLRSFADDKSTKKTVRRLFDSRSEEEMLIDVFNDIAPVYAIGNPSDKTMPYGASRIYVDDSIWKEVVEKLAIDAEIVILRLGQTNNFWWEVNMALKKVPAEKIVFVVPWSKKSDNVSTLKQTLLEHNIDITTLKVVTDKKRYGSISTVLFFNNGKPESHEIVIPRFTGMFFSYDNLLRNTLSTFREKYGFKIKKKASLIKSRILTAILLLFVIVGCGGKFYGHLLQMKYQRPYELVEECIKDEAFTSIYGDEVNSGSLSLAIECSGIGQLLLSDMDIVQMVLIEKLAWNQMSYSEYEQVNKGPYNFLLIIKKYFPEYYQDYIEIKSRATLAYVKNPEAAGIVLQYYQDNIENLPQWVFDFYEQYGEMSDEYLEDRWYDEMMRHIDEPDFADVIKTLIAQSLNPESYF